MYKDEIFIWQWDYDSFEYEKMMKHKFEQKNLDKKIQQKKKREQYDGWENIKIMLSNVYSTMDRRRNKIVICI